MEWNQQIMHDLSQLFIDSLSILPEPRLRAQSNLADASESPNYGFDVLRLVADLSVDEYIRQAAAVNFKNHIRTLWSPTSPISPISGSEKEEIKTLIVPLMLSSSSKIQSQLAEALALIGKHDFPKLWPNLLPELCSTLDVACKSSTYASINGTLAIVDSIFRKFREDPTDELILDLRYCLDQFQQPLLEVFTKSRAVIKSVVVSGGAAVSLVPLIESQSLCCSIFHSLNFLCLAGFFEDTIDTWMPKFNSILTAKYPALEESGADGLTLVDDLRSDVCGNVSHYVETEEELFQKYLTAFAEAVWNLLVVASASSGRDKLTMTGIKFLTKISTNPIYHTLFASDNVMEQFIESVVIPNVMLRDEDEDLFHTNYVEFIRRDMEGSDTDTRRRIACELLKGIATYYKEKVTEKVARQITSCLALFNGNQAANWKHKDCAIYLVVSLGSKKVGGNSILTDLVDAVSVFGSVIKPELTSKDLNGYPVLKAGALKFFTMLSNQISKSYAMELFPNVVKFLCSDSNVVHSYAASCVEKLLSTKNEDKKPRYTASDINPFLLPLMMNLFTALEKPESEENKYVMKCILRVLMVAEISTEVASLCITSLTSVLNRVCQNPKNPNFNYYLFEAVAGLVRRACERNPSLVPAFEESLFPSLEMILAKDVTEFYPYAFQLLSQLVELNRSPIPIHYLQIFQILLLPESWKKTETLPALVQLIQSFLRKGPNDLNHQEILTHVLEIFNKLVSSPETEEQGFYVLYTVVENLSYDIISPHMSNILTLLFTRLQKYRKAKFMKSLVIFMSLFLIKHGPQNLVDAVNRIQSNIFPVILEQFWGPNLKLIAGSIEVKIVSVASTRLVCESPVLLDPAASKLWGKMVDSIVTLLSRPEQGTVEEEPEVLDFVETVGYTATFVHLYNAAKKEEDPLKEILDPKQFFVASLANLSARNPGRFPRVLTENVEAANQTTLWQLCNCYNLYIV